MRVAINFTTPGFIIKTGCLPLSLNVFTERRYLCDNVSWYKF